MQKTIFITGASAGLGKATAMLFQSKGWHVIATMRHPEKETVLSQLDHVTLLQLDVTQPNQIREVIAKATTLYSIDLVVNNVGVGLVGPIEGLSDDQVAQQFDTNLLGAIRITQAFLPHFRQRKGGMFINITSMAGLVTFPFDSIYHTVKFGLQAFSESISYELAPFGIKVKTIAPGYIHTNFGSSMPIVTSEPYKESMDYFLNKMYDMMDPEKGSTAAQVADIVYEAATDDKDQLLYVAGNDAIELYSRRLEIGSEAARKEMATLFTAMVY